MPNPNPPMMVQFSMPRKLSSDAIQLLRLLLAAEVIEQRKQQTTYLLHPPKGTVSNNFWAESTYKRALELGIPALIVREA